MRLETGLLKQTAGVLAFGTALWLGAGTMTYVEAHDQYYDRGQSGNHQKQEKRAEKRHQKNEKQALKDHQREERRYYGNDRATREHQRQEREELKYHQRYEKDSRKQHQNYERDGYYYNDQNRRRYSRDRYHNWR